MGGSKRGTRVDRRRVALGVAVVAGTMGVASACGGSSGGGDVANGSGSSLAELAFGKWCGGSDVCTYDAIGSGGGIRELTEQDVAFAGSDVPLTGAEERELSEGTGDVAPQGAGAVQLPGLVAGVAVPTTVEGVDFAESRLKLTGETLAAIFSGEIDRWDAGEISAENPGLDLPDAEITLCVRGDSSGTSAVFTRFLADADPSFSGTVGASKLPDWPDGDRVVEVDGTQGVGDCVASQENAIGYLDLGDALAFVGDGTQDPEDVGQIAEIGTERNGEVEYVPPTVDSIATAGTVGVEEGADLTTYADRLVGADVPGAYPIAATTFIIARDRYADGAVCDATVEMIRFAFSDAGQDVLLESSFAPVPNEIRERALDQITDISNADGGPCGQVEA